jgi:cytochrome c biogenesis protein CcmG, thiol:disulfide interchange protein DsbE
MIDQTNSGVPGPKVAGIGPRARPNASASSRRLILLVPLALFAAIAAALMLGLTRNPELLPSPLIGKPVPQFSLPPIQGRAAGLSNQDLKGEVSLVNFFASWCVACQAEHPLFMRLAAEGLVPVHGIDYKDRPEDTAGWLARLGDPYTRTGADLDGRGAIEWGVYGVPETYVINRKGEIAYKHIGAVTERDLSGVLLPLVRRLQAEPRGVEQ